MTNKILQLMKIAVAATFMLMIAGIAKADLVYDTEFDIPYNGGSGDFVLGGASPDVVAEQWFGSTQTSGVGDGVLTLDYAFTGSRFRGSGVWLDTSEPGWTIGPVTVEVDVEDLVDGAGSTLFFQAYAANGVNAANFVSFDLHGGASGVATNQTVDGTSTIDLLDAQQAITANGTDVSFTFDYNGTDQFVGLVFGVQSNANTTVRSATLDNLTVNTTVVSVPEPSSSLVLIGAGLGLIGFRRRRLK